MMTRRLPIAHGSSGLLVVFFFLLASSGCINPKDDYADFARRPLWEAGLDFAEEDITFVGRDDLLVRLSKGMAQVTLVRRQLDSRGRSDAVFRAVLVGRPPLAMTKDPRARMLKQRFDSVTSMRRDEVTAPVAVFHLAETMMSPNRVARESSRILSPSRVTSRRIAPRRTAISAFSTACSIQRDSAISSYMTTVLFEGPPRR